jgi:hypothetical protein
MMCRGALPAGHQHLHLHQHHLLARLMGWIVDAAAWVPSALSREAAASDDPGEAATLALLHGWVAALPCACAPSLQVCATPSWSSSRHRPDPRWAGLPSRHHHLQCPIRRFRRLSLLSPRPHPASLGGPGRQSFPLETRGRGPALCGGMARASCLARLPRPTALSTQVTRAPQRPRHRCCFRCHCWCRYRCCRSRYCHCLSCHHAPACPHR